MKQIIIFLLVVIALLIGYGKYKQYKRFTPPEYEYTSSEVIDLNYHDRGFIKAYYQAIESMNGYVIAQWSNNGIDVRNPGNDDEETLAAMTKYEKRLGEVKYHEGQLVKSALLKKDGFDNEDIRLMEVKGLSAKEYQAGLVKETKNNMFRAMYKQEASLNNLRLGNRNAFIYEVQKLLIGKGHDIPLDGVFKNVTAEAIRVFEEKNGLFPDGRLDAITLEALLK